MEDREATIFPHMTKEEVMERLREEPAAYNRYYSMDGQWRTRFLDYCTGKKTLPVTYDRFFKKTFDPDVHPERLSRMLSSMLGFPVRVVKILPLEDSVFANSAMVILDILVELQDGSLANVEIQKNPYLFPAERLSCYSSDLVMRQYARVKGDRGEDFRYSDIRNVYTIVFYEKSEQIFHETNGKYIHYGEVVFDTGLELKLLQKYCLIALDVFRKNGYPKDKSERSGWLSFLATEDAADAERIVGIFPWLEEIYAEQKSYLVNMGEVLNMFSEALRILDHNTAEYMVELQQKQIEAQEEQIERQQKQIEQMQTQHEEEIASLQEEIARLKKQQSS